MYLFCYSGGNNHLDLQNCLARLFATNGLRPYAEIQLPDVTQPPPSSVCQPSESVQPQQFSRPLQPLRNPDAHQQLSQYGPIPLPSQGRLNSSVNEAALAITGGKKVMEQRQLSCTEGAAAKGAVANARAERGKLSPFFKP